MFPELCSYSSSIKLPFINHDTSGCGRPVMWIIKRDSNIAWDCYNILNLWSDIQYQRQSNNDDWSLGSSWSFFFIVRMGHKASYSAVILLAPICKSIHFLHTTSFWWHLSHKYFFFLAFTSPHSSSRGKKKEKSKFMYCRVTLKFLRIICHENELRPTTARWKKDIYLPKKKGPFSRQLFSIILRTFLSLLHTLVYVFPSFLINFSVTGCIVLKWIINRMIDFSPCYNDDDDKSVRKIETEKKGSYAPWEFKLTLFHPFFMNCRCFKYW